MKIVYFFVLLYTIFETFSYKICKILYKFVLVAFRFAKRRFALLVMFYLISVVSQYYTDKKIIIMFICMGIALPYYLALVVKSNKYFFSKDVQKIVVNFAISIAFFAIMYSFNVSSEIFMCTAILFGLDSDIFVFMNETPRSPTSSNGNPGGGSNGNPQGGPNGSPIGGPNGHPNNEPNRHTHVNGDTVQYSEPSETTDGTRAAQETREMRDSVRRTNISHINENSSAPWVSVHFDRRSPLYTMLDLRDHPHIISEGYRDYTVLINRNILDWERLDNPNITEQVQRQNLHETMGRYAAYVPHAGCRIFEARALLTLQRNVRYRARLEELANMSD